MDGLYRLTEAAAGDPAVARFLDILYAEDFDDLPEPAATPEPPPPEPTYTQAECERACADAVADARRDWEQAALERQIGLLANLSAQLASADEAARAVSLAAAEAVAKATLAALSALLPKFCDAHGAEEAAALAGRLLPLLNAEPKIVVRVHADEVADMQRAIAQIAPDHVDSITVSAAAVERGDLRVLWQNGTLVRDARQIMRAMQDALARLGLQETPEKSPKRSLAHAK